MLHTVYVGDISYVKTVYLQTSTVYKLPRAVYRCQARKEKNKVIRLKSVVEAAELLRISPWTVRSYIRDGKLKPVRLGRRVLLAEDELERLVAEGQEQAGRDPQENCERIGEVL
jgi:excisionase family DNA binding protein